MDSGADGHFAANRPIPDVPSVSSPYYSSAGGIVGNYAVEADGTLYIPTTGTFPQTYTFGSSSDDGFSFQIVSPDAASPSVSFGSATNATIASTMTADNTFEYNTGRAAADSMATATFTHGGYYQVRFLTFQSGTGAGESELYSATGSFTSWSARRVELDLGRRQRPRRPERQQAAGLGRVGLQDQHQSRHGCRGRSRLGGPGPQRDQERGGQPALRGRPIHQLYEHPGPKRAIRRKLDRPVQRRRPQHSRLRISTDADGYVLVATATVNIPAAGTWTFGNLQDTDGGGYEVDITGPGGFSFHTQADAGNGLPDGSLFAVNFAAAGNYNLRYLYFENSGQSSCELFAQPGSFTSWAAGGDNWRLVGDTAHGGLTLVRPVAGDGSQLWIDGQLVVDNQGIYAPADRSGSVSLSAGVHTIEAAYYQASGTASLSLSWAGPGIDNQPIPASVLYHDPNVQAPTVPQNVTATGLADSIRVGWTASSDDTGVAGYEVFRDGQEIATTIGPYYTDAAVQPGVTATYTVVAVDADGNASAASQPASGARLTGYDSGVYYRYYRGQWSTLPNFSTLQPVTAGTVSTPNLSVALDSQNYAAQYSGNLDVPESGTYMFYTSSDDGSRLWIDGQLVVDNDGAHAVQERAGTKTLTAGVHTITVGYFQSGGASSLVASWSGPDLPRQTIPTSVLSRLPDTQPPTAPQNLTTLGLADSVRLAWAVSTDDNAVAGYRVFRDGQQIATTLGPYYTDTAAQAGVAASYSVVAVDAVGNLSAASQATAGTRLTGFGSGLYYCYYSGQWTTLPNFSTLQPVTAGITGSVNLSVALDSVNYALQYSGKLDVPESGAYTFYTNSDDGSRLWIDGQLVVNNDGVHATQETSGSLTLAAGVHTISVVYFQSGGISALTASWSGPDLPKQAIPATVLSHVPDTQAPTVPQSLTTLGLAGNVRLTWAASTDDTGVAGYQVFRDGQQIATIIATYYSDTTAQPGVAASYTVVAVDAEGNLSAASQSAAGTRLTGFQSGVAYRYYTGQWNALPSLPGLMPTNMGTSSVLNNSVRQQDYNYALEFTGQLEVPSRANTPSTPTPTTAAGCGSMAKWWSTTTASTPCRNIRAASPSPPACTPSKSATSRPAGPVRSPSPGRAQTSPSRRSPLLRSSTTAARRTSTPPPLPRWSQA